MLKRPPLDGADSDEAGWRGCARYGRLPTDEIVHPGESLECPGCGTVYLAIASDDPAVSEAEIRCIACRAALTPRPQTVRFELIETADEAAGPSKRAWRFRSGR